MTRKAPDPTHGSLWRYANLARILDRACTFGPNSKRVDGVILGIWTENDGTPSCIVLTADGRLNRVCLEDVRVRNAAFHVLMSTESSDGAVQRRDEAIMAERLRKARSALGHGRTAGRRRSHLDKIAEGGDDDLHPDISA